MLLLLLIKNSYISLCPLINCSYYNYRHIFVTPAWLALCLLDRQIQIQYFFKESKLSKLSFTRRFDRWVAMITRFYRNRGLVSYRSHYLKTSATTEITECSRHTLRLDCVTDSHHTAFWKCLNKKTTTNATVWALEGRFTDYITTS